MSVWWWVLMGLGIWVVLSIPSALVTGRVIARAEEVEHGQDTDA